VALPSPEKKHWSRQEIVSNPDGPERYEVIEGELFVTPAPGSAHQNVVTQLAAELTMYARQHDSGVVYVAPLDVVIDAHQSLQPDVLFISEERRNIVKDCVEGPPDLVIEVLSPSTSSRDRVIKSRVYAEFGVPHYWIVDPSDKTLLAYQLVEGQYVLIGTGTNDETFEPILFPGLTIALATLWS
jgi:Uma2 family endonuclease